MVIEATTPTTADLTYDRWTIDSVMQIGDGLANFGESEVRTISLTITLVKFRVRGDGVPERSPFPGDRATVTIPDLYGRAASNPTTATGLEAFTAAVVEAAREQGVL